MMDSITHKIVREAFAKSFTNEMKHYLDELVQIGFLSTYITEHNYICFGFTSEALEKLNHELNWEYGDWLSISPNRTIDRDNEFTFLYQGYEVHVGKKIAPIIKHMRVNSEKNKLEKLILVKDETHKIMKV